nr:MAG TPA: hypothetical protein [Caudoviricetes sp.]
MHPACRKIKPRRGYFSILRNSGPNYCAAARPDV